jgi:hypothetical protein
MAFITGAGSPGGLKKNVPLIGGFALVTMLLEARHSLDVVRDCFKQCGCNSAAEVLSYIDGLSDAVFSGLLVHVGVLVGIIGAIAVLARLAVRKWVTRHK